MSKTPLSSPRWPRNQSPNVVHFVLRRQIFGVQGPRTDLNPWRGSLPNTEIKLGKLFKSSILQSGHIFLGFSRCGRFLYTLVSRTGDILFADLHIWLYHLGGYSKHLRCVSRIFDAPHLDQMERGYMYLSPLGRHAIGLSHWPEDQSKIVLWAYLKKKEHLDMKTTAELCITVTSLPDIAGCEDCLKATEDQEYIERYQRKQCTVHGLTLRTHCELVSPYPWFVPEITLALNSCLIINTGNFLHFVELEWLNQNGKIRRLPSNRISSEYRTPFQRTNMTENSIVPPGQGVLINPTVHNSFFSANLFSPSVHSTALLSEDEDATSQCSGQAISSRSAPRGEWDTSSVCSDASIDISFASPMHYSFDSTSERDSGDVRSISPALSSGPTDHRYRRDSSKMPGTCNIDVTAKPTRSPKFRRFLAEKTYEFVDDSVPTGRSGRSSASQRPRNHTYCHAYNCMSPSSGDCPQIRDVEVLKKRRRAAKEYRFNEENAENKLPIPGKRFFKFTSLRSEESSSTSYSGRVSPPIAQATPLSPPSRPPRTYARRRPKPAQQATSTTFVKSSSRPGAFGVFDTLLGIECSPASSPSDSTLHSPGIPSPKPVLRQLNEISASTSLLKRASSPQSSSREFASLIWMAKEEGKQCKSDGSLKLDVTEGREETKLTSSCVVRVNRFFVEGDDEDGSVITHPGEEGDGIPSSCPGYHYALRLSVLGGGKEPVELLMVTAARARRSTCPVFCFQTDDI